MPENFINLRRDMRDCQQTPNQNVLEHGFSVARKFAELYDYIQFGKPLYSEWKLPEWIHYPDLFNFGMSYKDIQTYQIYHDCGKPYCQTIDDNGRSHFPEHAEYSAAIWQSLNQNDDIYHCILHDMDIHTIKDKEIDDFIQLPQWRELLITGLCEIHANAAMFGGIDSTSFKIKWKQINKRARKILNKQTGEKL